jgi:hypothetical protein
MRDTVIRGKMGFVITAGKVLVVLPAITSITSATRMYFRKTVGATMV